MTQTQTLHKLLLTGVNRFEFQINAKDLNSQFEAVGSVFVSLEWLVKDYDTGYQCSQCGAVHEVVAVNDKFYIGCDVDEFSGLEQLEKNDLLIYRFSNMKLAQWLSEKLELQETVQTQNENTWHLGKWQTEGKKRDFYFTNKVSTVPSKKGRIILLVGDNQHHSQPDVVNILEFLEFTSQGVVLDSQEIKSLFSVHEPVQGLTVSISDKLKLTQSEGKKQNFLHMGIVSQGQHEHVVKITPIEFNLAFHLDKIRNTPNSKKTSKELAEAGISKTGKSVTTQIGKLNKKLANKNWDPLILRDSENKYYMNPELYT